jgi:hypothetical protein
MSAKAGIAVLPSRAATYGNRRAVLNKALIEFSSLSEADRPVFLQNWSGVRESIDPDARSFVGRQTIAFLTGQISASGRLSLRASTLSLRTFNPSRIMRAPGFVQ